MELTVAFFDLKKANYECGVARVATLVYHDIKVKEGQEGMVKMANLTDLIEQYLKRLLANSETGSVDIRRNQLAEIFSCAPSQINYVLSTRFLLEHGYIVETRRGGGGYVRITVLDIDPERDWRMLIDSIGETTSQQKAEAIIKRLLRDGLISDREALMMSAVIDRDVLNVEQPWCDVLRANILRSLLIAVYRTL